MEKDNLFKFSKSSTSSINFKNEITYFSNLKSIFFNNKISFISFIFFLILLFSGLVILIFFTLDPNEIYQSALGPDSNHLMGTDLEGRDVWSRFWYSFYIMIALSIFISFTNIFLSSLITFLLFNWNYSGFLFNFIFKILKVLPSLFVLIILTLLFNETYLIIFISFTITWWSIFSEQIEKQINSLNSDDYIWKSETQGTKRRKTLFSLFILMSPFLIYKFFRNIPFIILYESLIGVIGIHNSDILTLGSCLGENIKLINEGNTFAISINLFIWFLLLFLMQLFIINVDKEKFYSFKMEIK